MDHFDSATVEAKIIETRRDGEALVFEIPLGLLKIVCIANIPPEGESKAPVYLRFMKGELLKNLMGPKSAPRVKRPTPISAPRKVEPRSVEVIRIPKGPRTA